MSTSLHSGSTTSDVLIVGVGPAAVAAALTATANGLSAVLVARRPRKIKESHHLLQSFHPDVRCLMTEMQALHVLENSLASIFRSVTINDEEYSLSPETSDNGFHVHRSLFDDGLLALALDRGVHLIYSDTLRLISSQDRLLGLRLDDDKEVRARFTLDGSGSSRVLARTMRIRQRYYSPKLLVQTGVIREPGRDWTHRKTTFSPRPQGWQWTTPSFGGFMTWTALLLPKDRWNEELVALRERSEHGSVNSADASWRLSRPVAKPGMLLIGEAAGHLDPAWGRGVLSALSSGRRAISTILSITAEPAMEGWHEADYDQWFVNGFEDAAEILAQAYEERGIDMHIRSHF